VGVRRYVHHGPIIPPDTAKSAPPGGRRLFARGKPTSFRRHGIDDSPFVRRLLAPYNHQATEPLGLPRRRNGMYGNTLTSSARSSTAEPNLKAPQAAARLLAAPT